MGFGCNSSTGKRHYVLAERLFSDHKYSAAVEEFKQIIEADPKSSLAQQALFRIGVIQYLYLDRHREAVRSFKQFVAVSENQELVFQAEKSLAEIYLNRMEDYRQAVEQYRKILEKYPKSEERDFFLLRLAKAYYGALDFDNAIVTYRQLVKEYPKSQHVPEALYQIGNTLYTKGAPADIDQATAAFKDVINRYPDSQQAVFAQFGIGNCLEEKDQIDEALAIYTKLLDKHPARGVVEAKIFRLKERKNRAR